MHTDPDSVGCSLHKMAVRFGWTPEEVEAVSKGWPLSPAHGAPGIPDALQPAQFLAAAAYCHVPVDLFPVLQETAREIRTDPALCALAFHAACQVTESPDYYSFHHWPDLTRPLGERQGFFFLLAALAVVPKARRGYAAMGIPEDIIRDTLTQISRFIGNHRVGTGRPGVFRSQLGWIGHYARLRLFRLGRFEYKIERHQRPCIFYRNRISRRVIGLAPDGARYDAAGLMLPPDAPEFAWQATREESDGRVTGTPLSPFGVSLNRTIRLPRTEWDVILREGDPVLDMHIPPGGGMNPEACRDSLSQAFEFFAARFPETGSSPVTCASWIFNTQFEDEMPDSNLTAFMRQLYLHPVPSGGGMDGFSFVFWRTFSDLSEAPRETRLQRAMLGILQSGRALRSGGMAFFREEMPKFGAEPYRTDWTDPGEK